MQIIFTLVAKSQAMLADCAAMSVDVITYLFNWCAERLKHIPLTDDEKQMPIHLLHHKKRLQRLYLELVPPLLSVTTLLVVTIISFHDAITTIIAANESHEDVEQPNVHIMLIFSAMNLLLDAMNVSCFARVDHAPQGLSDLISSHPHHHHHHHHHLHHHQDHYSLEQQQQQHHHHHHHHQRDENYERPATELTGLMDNIPQHIPIDENITTCNQAEMTEQQDYFVDDDDDDDDEDDNNQHHVIDLNMCSAWTVRVSGICPQFGLSQHIYLLCLILNFHLYVHVYIFVVLCCVALRCVVLCCVVSFTICLAYFRRYPP